MTNSNERQRPRLSSAQFLLPHTHLLHPRIFDTGKVDEFRDELVGGKTCMSFVCSFSRSYAKGTLVVVERYASHRCSSVWAVAN